MATRRLFLQQSVLALAATLSAPTLLAAVDVTAPDTTRQPQRSPTLDATSFAILTAVTEAVIPSGGAFATGAREIELAARIDSYLPKDDPALLTGIQGALLFTEAKAPALIGSEQPFSRLSVGQQQQTLLAMQQGDALTKTIFTALRGLALFYFYTDERVWPHIGYDGTLLQQAQAAQRIGG